MPHFSKSAEQRKKEAEEARKPKMDKVEYFEPARGRMSIQQKARLSLPQANNKAINKVGIFRSKSINLFCKLSCI
jgi:hypothetical protein